MYRPIPPFTIIKVVMSKKLLRKIFNKKFSFLNYLSKLFAYNNCSSHWENWDETMHVQFQRIFEGNISLHGKILHSCVQLCGSSINLGEFPRLILSWGAFTSSCVAIVSGEQFPRASCSSLSIYRTKQLETSGRDRERKREKERSRNLKW